MSIVRLNYNGIDYIDEIAADGGSIEMTHAMVGETLAADTLTVPVIVSDKPIRIIGADQDDIDFIVSSDDYIVCASNDVVAPDYIKNAPGYLYFNNDLVTKQFLYQIRRENKHTHKMTFYSAIWLLDFSKHFGGLYTGEPAGDVLADIMGEIPYTVDEDIAAIQIYGYLPYDTRRNNLHKFLMATGAAVKNAPDGSLRITSLSDTVVGTFDQTRIFVGGTVEEKIPCTAVQVTEHNYIESSEEVTLYENTSVNTELITFAEPYHDYSITNGTILESGVNYVKFEGAGLVTIKGKKYIHITRVITVGDEPTGSPDDVVRTVSENTLITPFNAVDIAERIYEYFSVSKSIKQDVRFGYERPGDVVKVVDPYTKELVTATIKSMSIVLGFAEIRANSEFLVGYTPPSLISGFTNYTVLTGSGEWTVPEGVTKIRVIIVGAGGGGDGGSGGYSGAYISSQVSGNPGGAGGAAGNPGKILEINLNVTPSMKISYACGTKGLGGAGGSGGSGGGRPGGAGQSGTSGAPTTFGPYSSELGRLYPDGYTEPKTGMILGKAGIPGVKGGDASDMIGTFGTPDKGEDVTFDGITYIGGSDGQSIPNFYNNQIGIGGAGGGAAVGSNGGNGTGPSWYTTPSRAYPRHGDGGAGGHATIDGADAIGYGGAGSGGHGGGAGGNAVLFTVWGDPWFSGTPASGGNGSKGGDGADGCVIVYY